ncbi:hypothetical protein PM082_013289 [Marasmius tenuissimus]|nr:hypothetical protein PM082_013289 [Marasmius tenuissimus]
MLAGRWVGPLLSGTSATMTGRSTSERRLSTIVDLCEGSVTGLTSGGNSSLKSCIRSGRGGLSDDHWENTLNWGESLILFKWGGSASRWQSQFVIVRVDGKFVHSAWQYMLYDAWGSRELAGRTESDRPGARVVQLYIHVGDASL